MKFFINKPNNIIPDNETTKIIAEDDNALEFHQSLSEYHMTPLHEINALSKEYGVGQIFVKDESFRFGLNAFKGLGASYAMQKYKEVDTYCTATDGNHGRAVAWSATKLKKSSVVYVPRDTTFNRIRAIEAEGAKVIQTSFNYADTCQKANEKAQEKNWLLIQDTAWEGYEEIPALIMKGYQTMFIEIDLQLKPIGGVAQYDIIILQAGVGSMAAAGIFYYLNVYGNKRPKIVIVEPEESNGILQSFKNDRITASCGNSKTIMAGLNCELPSYGAWQLIRNGADCSVVVSDADTRKAMRNFYYSQGNDTKIISGESGAAGLAALITTLENPDYIDVKNHLNINTNSRILLFNTEGDTDSETYKNIIGGQEYSIA